MDRATCKIANCLRKHPTVLHTNTNDIEKNRIDTRGAEKEDKGTSTEDIKEVNVGSTTCDDNKQRPTLTGAGKSVIARAIVPVKVRVRGTDEAIITYAFLDNGSDSTVLHRVTGSAIRYRRCQDQDRANNNGAEKQSRRQFYYT